MKKEYSKPEIVEYEELNKLTAEIRPTNGEVPNGEVFQ